MRNFRILPLLIFVAMLSFSIRLVEVLDGVFEITGPEAYAEAPKDEPVEPLMIKDDHEGEDHAEEAEDKKSKPKEDFPEWRDPADDDPAY